jgi:hypothetical protein
MVVRSGGFPIQVPNAGFLCISDIQFAGVDVRPQNQVIWALTYEDRVCGAVMTVPSRFLLAGTLQGEYITAASMFIAHTDSKSTFRFVARGDQYAETENLSVSLGVDVVDISAEFVSPLDSDATVYRICSSGTPTYIAFR